uniref:uncharacterized protein LOC122593828 n=1 Tax=Erigeron canadensis TaxID=72917 RepID=UPI001CB91466|nr:uncharacterized protein LOC122593828 [Erigeron canadensis]
MSERSSRDTLNAFCDGVIRLYRHEYLRRPMRNDMQRIFDHHASYHGFPVAWRDQYTRSDHYGPTISLEAVASQDCGTTPVVPFTVYETEYKYPYFLVDGIYPRYAMFVKMIPHPTGEKRIQLAPTDARLAEKRICDGIPRLRHTIRCSTSRDTRLKHSRRSSDGAY